MTIQTTSNTPPKHPSPHIYHYPLIVNFYLFVATLVLTVEPHRAMPLVPSSKPLDPLDHLVPLHPPPKPPPTPNSKQWGCVRPAYGQAIRLVLVPSDNSHPSTLNPHHSTSIPPRTSSFLHSSQHAMYHLHHK